MPPKAKSATTSSTSATSKPPGETVARARTSSPASADGAETPIQFVKGVGPKLGALLKSRGLATVKDIFTFFPRAYEDRSKLKKVSEVLEGESATLTVKVGTVKKIPIRAFGKGGMNSILEVRASDETGGLSLKWFHAPRGMEERFIPGVELIVHGTIKMYMGRPEIVHPEISWSASSSGSISWALFRPALTRTFSIGPRSE